MLEHGDVYKIEERSVFYCKFFMKSRNTTHQETHTMNEPYNFNVTQTYAGFWVSHAETLPAVYMTRTIQQKQPLVIAIVCCTLKKLFELPLLNLETRESLWNVIIPIKCFFIPQLCKWSSLPFPTLQLFWTHSLEALLLQACQHITNLRHVDHVYPIYVYH